MIQVEIALLSLLRKHRPGEDEFNECPYYVSRVQPQFIITKRRWFRAQYLHNRFIIEELGNANSIHAFNQFE